MKNEIKLFLIFLAFIALGFCQNCKPDEEWKKCGTCESTCQDPNPICLKMCRSPRCMCKKGTVRNVDGSCIPLEQCPPEINSTDPHSDECGENEIFAMCPCEKTCKNPKVVCPLTLRVCPSGKPRCQCKAGYARNADKVCVPISECHSNDTCGKNEELKTCPGCEPTCDEPNPICNALCIQGEACQCKKRFFRNKDGECVPRGQCPPSTVRPIRVKRDGELQCGENERVTQCSGCESNCAFLDRMCTMECNNIPACECESGYSRDATGQCIPTNECPDEGSRVPRDTNLTCGENEHVVECSGCESNCAFLDRMCPMICNNIPACECQPGFSRDSTSGKCIPTDDCPVSSNITCGKNEELNPCPGCEPTCTNPSPICPKRPCIIGQGKCECKSGFYRDFKGKCVTFDHCSNHGNKTCGKNEELRTCPMCEATCTNPNPVCPFLCILGPGECRCKSGFYRNSAGECVRFSQCPNHGNDTCGEHEILKSCPGCEPSCKDPNPICPLICRIGQECECENGFYRNSAGNCVTLDECSHDGNVTCDENEELRSCPGCEPSCKNPNPICPRICRPGRKCRCKKGFYRDSTGDCVELEECREEGNKTCDENEELQNCPGCEASCYNPDPICPEICHPGQKCQCKKGFLRNIRGDCVSPDLCYMSAAARPNKKCPKGEVWTECGSCEGSCDDLNPICILECRPAGCYCKRGFVRGPNGDCIPKGLCRRPPRSTRKPTTEYPINREILNFLHE
uniref:EGF-like domain-containing protein n=1 Tax=Panagrolaimus sp. JU765 TaxID=591449 RepID=A0AC34QZR9_9BILA